MVVSHRASRQHEQLLGHGHLLTGDVLSFSCLNLLLRSLSQSLTLRVVMDILQGHQGSSQNQYALRWNAFQLFFFFLGQSHMSFRISFSSPCPFLFHEEGWCCLPLWFIMRLSGTLWEGFQLSLDPHRVDILQEGFIHQHPTPPLPVPSERSVLFDLP